LKFIQSLQIIDISKGLLHVPTQPNQLVFIFESANFVSLRFCVLDNNIRDIKYVLSCAVLTDEELPGRIFQPGVAG
jgi:hypothetical protein